MSVFPADPADEAMGKNPLLLQQNLILDQRAKSEGKSENHDSQIDLSAQPPMVML